MSKKIYYLIIGLIFLLSFRFFCTLYYPLLNTDDAVTVLMIHYFKLPDNLYYWGQDRLGSIIPLLAQPFYKLFHIPLLTSEAIVHYGILLLGFFSFASFLKSPFYKIIFALIWFFPPTRMLDITQYSFGIHYSMIAMICYLFAVNEKESIQKSKTRHHSLLFLIMVLIIATIWVSDMAIVTIFIIGAVRLFFFFKSHKFSDAFRKPELYYALVGIIVGYLFIQYAKSTAPEYSRRDYSMFAPLEHILENLINFAGPIWRMAIFRPLEFEPLTGLYIYLALVVIVLAVVYCKKARFDLLAKKNTLTFLLDGFLLFGIIIAAEWTFLNESPRRYYTCTYISLSLVILLIFDNLTIGEKIKKSIQGIFLITVLVGAVGAVYHLAAIQPKTLKPTVETYREFEKLGEIGVISEYWHSYVISCTNPEMIKATSDDSYYPRNYGITLEAIARKNLYVIRDRFIDTFPDTLKQFNHRFKKSGNEFEIGGCHVCKYEKIE